MHTSEDNGTILFPAAHARKVTKEIPTLIPVKEPGPVTTLLWGILQEEVTT